MKREYPEGVLLDCEPLPRLEKGDRASIILNRLESVAVHDECMINHNILIEYLDEIDNK